MTSGWIAGLGNPVNPLMEYVNAEVGVRHEINIKH
jgi:hypothetical protein